MNSADFERLAGLEDALTLAAHGPTFRLNWELEVNGVKLVCKYWSGPYNDNRVSLIVPLAAPGRVTGSDCFEYREGVALESRSWRDYPENDDPNNPNNFHVRKGGDPHGPTCAFEIYWTEEGQWGKPANSPFTIADANLAKLCDYSGRFVEIRPEVAAAVRRSWQAQMVQRRMDEVAAADMGAELP